MGEVRLKPGLDLRAEVVEGGGGFPKPGQGCAKAAELWGPQGSPANGIWTALSIGGQRATLGAHGSQG